MPLRLLSRLGIFVRTILALACLTLAGTALAQGSTIKVLVGFPPGGGTDATDARQLHLDPFGHAVALHQYDFFFKRIQGVPSDPVDDDLSQVFGAVAVKGNEAWL